MLTIRRILFIAIMGWFFVFAGAIFLALAIVGLPFWFIFGGWEEALETSKFAMLTPWELAEDCWPRY